MDHAGVPGKRGGDAQQRIRTRAIAIGTDRRHKRKSALVALFRWRNRCGFAVCRFAPRNRLSTVTGKSSGLKTSAAARSLHSPVRRRNVAYLQVGLHACFVRR
ncbi:hypothetical protein C7S13_1235 [Burkholderia cepacia]|nr:hypothetical protein [Burkholderia cepacia]